MEDVRWEGVWDTSSLGGVSGTICELGKGGGMWIDRRESLGEGVREERGEDIFEPASGVGSLIDLFEMDQVRGDEERSPFKYAFLDGGRSDIGEIEQRRDDERGIERGLVRFRC